MTVKYIERRMIDRFKCIDTEKEIRLNRPFRSGGLLYGYIDRFNVVSIESDMIISIDGVPGPYAKRHNTERR